MKCDYCKTVSNDERCPSCGAPRHQKRGRLMIIDPFGVQEFTPEYVKLHPGYNPIRVQWIER